jgi:PadR family transcriptional regulator, regulatory protein PadR
VPRPDPESHLPLRDVELDILVGVVDRARHGYAILQEADERTEGHPGYEIPTLYRALHRLRDSGLIRSAEAPAGEEEDPRREYWRATALGRRVLAAELRRLEVKLAAARSRMTAEEA